MATWLRSNWIFYPYDGQTDVPPGWNGLESPDPLPDVKGMVGFPITAYPRCGLDRLRLRRLTVVSERGQAVKSAVFEGDPFLDGFGLIPLERLKHGTEYRVDLQVHDTVADTTFTLSWRFRTALLGSVAYR